LNYVAFQSLFSQKKKTFGYFVELSNKIIVVGLDATVYCNCFETDSLREIPPFVDLIYVSAHGGLDCKSENLNVQLEFDQWLMNRACEHEDGVLLHHYIGNIALVCVLRNELQKWSENFQIILEKILYSGTHAGDFLTLEDIEKLSKEIDFLEKLRGSTEQNQEFLNDFRVKLCDLVQASTKVSKPISF
jgi:hypothetical protein